MTKLYQFSAANRKSYEQLNFALAVYQEAEGKLVPLLVSDGLCQLYQLGRDELLKHLKAVDHITVNLLTAPQQLITCRIKLAESYQTVLLHVSQQIFAGQTLLFVDYINIGNDQVDLRPAQIGHIPSNEQYEDNLTGLLNSVYLTSFGQDYLDSKLRVGDQPRIIMFNIVGMHGYNEHFGYLEGDRFLVRISRQLLRLFPDSLVLRYNEDRFVVLSTSNDYIEKIKELQRFVLRNYSVGGVKAGIYFYVNPRESIKSAVDKARKALQYTGDDLTQLYHVFDENVREKYINRDYVLTHFQEALDKRWIKPYYQMEIRSLTGQICGYEALARWIDPAEGVLSPAVFIGVLEDTHLINRLDLSIIEQVCEMLASCYQRKIPIQPVSVNLSRVDFQVCDIFAEVDAIRRRYKIPTSYLKIEILESTLTTVPEQLRAAMDKFHAAGYQIWMDDFGSGYSSLNNLKDFDFDLLKIDMIFLRNFQTNSRSHIILREIVDMAKHLGIHTLCEGVESKEQAEFLRAIGCDRLQGFHFSKPIPEEEMLAEIKRRGLAEYEPQEMNDYYDKIGETNILVNPMVSHISQGIKHLEMPLALIERRPGKQLVYYFTNFAYQDELTRHHLTPAEWQKIVNDSLKYKSLLLSLMAKSKKVKACSTGMLDDRSSLEVKHLACYKDRDMYICTIGEFGHYIDKTRQDKTRQDKTRQDKTRQDKTRQDKTRQDKTRQDKTRQDKTRQ
ncbi:GGDEF domain-containing phosphodiesterase, partial [Lactobacillus nasalidis]|uniref:GGDEF domain-containing phosphodiesterase n=2 Tax=Lactobacillus nasalidis TaxID=2797258 RepID=UPI001915317A